MAVNQPTLVFPNSDHGWQVEHPNRPHRCAPDAGDTYFPYLGLSFRPRRGERDFWGSPPRIDPIACPWDCSAQRVRISHSNVWIFQAKSIFFPRGRCSKISSSRLSNQRTGFSPLARRGTALVWRGAEAAIWSLDVQRGLIVGIASITKAGNKVKVFVPLGFTR